MKITPGKHRRRGWVLWAFLVVVAIAVVICKLICSWANSLNPPNPPTPPPADNTNNPPTTNPPPRTDIAAFFMVAQGDGPPPLIASITYGVMPAGDGVIVAIVDQTPACSTPPVPMDATSLSNNQTAWLNNWGIDVDGSLAADWAEQGYIWFSEDGLAHWAFYNAESPGYIVQMDANSFTYTLPSSPSNAPPYLATIQRAADASMRSWTNLDTKAVTVGQFQTFIDYAAPSDAAFYRVSVQKQ